MQDPKQKQGPSMKVLFYVDERGIVEIKLSPKDSPMDLEWEMVGFHELSSLKELIGKWMESYLNKREPDVYLPIVLDGLPPYTTRVLSALKDIPFGQSLSYKELATITGKPLGARAVGNACSRNPCPLVIPCHRVLAASSRLGGFSCGLDIKKTLLDYEEIPYS